jgi:hypothetical protein
MSDKEYRWAYLEPWRFEPMPSPAEQKRQHAAEQKRLQAGVEQKLATRSRLSRDTAPERRGVTREQMFSNLRRFMNE